MVATKDMCKYCFDCLVVDKPHKAEPNFQNLTCALFVTWKILKSDEYVLRGCIGTFSPTQIHKGLKEYALISAYEDTRFDPIEKSEISKLKCSISLLNNFTEAKDVLDWEIGKHGIQIKFRNPRNNRFCSATYLPEVCVECGWTKEQCLKSLYRKAGYRGPITEELRNSTKLVTYESHKESLTYEEYVSM